MNEKEIRKIMDSHQKIADRNYRNYQETGISRYERAYEKADDIVTICMQALSAVKDHEELTAVKGELSILGAEAIRLSHTWSEGSAFALVKNLAAYARMHGVYDPYARGGRDGKTKEALRLVRGKRIRRIYRTPERLLYLV